ncbi:hypothetical protein [Pseudoduganella armeniaca]|uniref:Uncharacterized protein n=1 Tax=Pseudoduganella armeniaca TaxID=2072590 RepID=A0A2R4C5T1_9BURK|nr:hypothetical protein [Pseudoduganella armeniaca]AVR94969.1 hypothetical protein C9I28_03985 [Pseudoduganella armeniaca]
MSDVAWLDAKAAASLFGAGSGHVPVTLQRLRGARVLWLNQQVAACDPAFAAAGGTLAAYERHLLASCAYAVASPGTAFDAGDEITAHADRYGGPGIGLNGGSGRAAVLGGYHVKGIGRTPLVSALTDPTHASGGAYLEEAVRETVFAEVVRHEFPHGAVPVLAILDTGLTQDWGSVRERRVLVVRPCFLRPAHFVRAVAFHSGHPTEGAADAARVRHMFDACGELLGKTRLVERCLALWTAWAEQLAYSFVHRLPHGSNTISNICLDGKLVDFGATSAVPSWADTATMLARVPFEALRAMLPRVLRSDAYYYERHLDAAFGSAAVLDALCARIEQAFQRTTVIEVLRLAGICRSVAAGQADGSDAARWWQLVHVLIADCQREQVDLVERGAPHGAPWTFAQLWSSSVPRPLRPLRDALECIVRPAQRELAALRCARLAATRHGLLRERIKPVLQRHLDPGGAGLAPRRRDIEDAICARVAANRRDPGTEIADAACVGFAVGLSLSYAVYQGADGALFALEPGAPGVRHAIAGWTAASLRFADPARPVFDGAVALRPLPGYPLHQPPPIPAQ